MTAFDEFLDALRKYRSLVAWITTVSIALPLAASQVDLTPPWPKGVVLLTAIWQALAIIAAFQFGRRLSHQSANRAMVVALVLLVVFGIGYCAALSQLAFYGGPARERLVKGLACTAEARSLAEFSAKCPLLDDRLIEKAESPEQLWTPSSITLSRLMLLGLWLAAYLPLAVCVALFIIFQSRRAGRGAPPKRVKRPHRSSSAKP